MTGPLRAVKPADAVIVILILALAVATGFFAYGRGGTSVRLVIEGPTGAWVYDLKADRTVHIPGRIGETLVEIASGKARIVDSPCPTKSCVAQPPVSHKGEWTACLPNGVILRVEGGSMAGGVDAMVY